jgi:hypothetical protein
VEGKKRRTALVPVARRRKGPTAGEVERGVVGSSGVVRMRKMRRE